jgi:hypothetical protein
MSTNKSSIANGTSQRVTALKKYVTPKTEIAINGEHYKLADLIAVFQSSLDAQAEVTTKRAELKAALNVRDDAETAAHALDRGLKAWVANQYGDSSQEAHEFGYPPPRTAEKSVKTKMRAVEQALATRKARHTMGKKEKSKIKGTMVAPTEPAAPAITVTPQSNGITNGASAPLQNGVASH